MKHPDYLNLLIAIDQLINVLCGGEPDETLSSRAYRLAMERGRTIPMRIIDMIFFWQENHCKTAYESEMQRLHVPPQMRGN